MRAGQAGPALGVGRLGRSSNCSSSFPTKGRCGSNYRPLLAQNHKPPLRGSRTFPVLHEQDHDLKIQAASLCEAWAMDSCGSASSVLTERFVQRSGYKNLSSPRCHPEPRRRRGTSHSHRSLRKRRSRLVRKQRRSFAQAQPLRRYIPGYVRTTRYFLWRNVTCDCEVPRRLRGSG